MKLELVRKQNTFRLNEETIDSLSETISETSLSKLGWWCPLTSNRKDQLTLAVEVPVSSNENGLFVYSYQHLLV